MRRWPASAGWSSAFGSSGFDWFGIFGGLPAYEHVGIWGWLIIALGVLWLLVAAGLWTLQPWAWLTTFIVAGLGLFEAFLWFVQSPGSGVGFGMADPQGS